MATRRACSVLTAAWPPIRLSARRRCIAATTSPPSCAATSSSSIPQPTSSAESSSTIDGTRLVARKAYREHRVPDLDRRTLPAGVPVERAGRHAVPCRHVSRHHPAPRLHHGVPPRSDPVAEAGGAERPWAHLSNRARDRPDPPDNEATSEAGAVAAVVSDSPGRAPRASERMVARHGAAAAGRTRGCLRRWRAEDSPRPRPTRRRACTRCGRSMGSTASTPAWSRERSPNPSRDVRVSAIRLSERWLSEPGSALQAAVLKLAHDPDWAVRRQLAASLGELPAGVRETALAGLLERHGDDPVTVDAALSGVRGGEPACSAHSSRPRPRRRS